MDTIEGVEVGRTVEHARGLRRKRDDAGMEPRIRCIEVATAGRVDANCGRGLELCVLLGVAVGFGRGLCEE